MRKGEAVESTADESATGANRQPAAATYIRPPRDSEYRAFGLAVLRVEDGAVAEVAVFAPGLFPAFGLPAALS